MDDEENLTDEQLQKSKVHVINTLHDLFGDFIYYDRKEDEDLPRDRIELLVERGLLTPDEIISEFGKHVRKHFE